MKGKESFLEARKFEEVHCRAVTILEPSWRLQDVQALVVDSPYYAEVQEKLKQGKLLEAHYKKFQGVW